MPLRRPAGLPTRVQESETVSVEPDVTKVQGDSAEKYTKRPFVERRRRRRADQSWPEAQEAVQRILTGFENGDRQLSDQENRFRAIFEDAPVGIFELDAQGTLLNLNSAMARIVGCETPEQALAESAEGSITLFHPAHWGSYEPAAGSQDVRGFDLELKARDGSSKWIRCHVREIRDQDRVLRYEGTAEDVTKRKLLEVHTERLAYYDALTGLPNRTLFHARLEALLQKAMSQKARIGLFLLQVDRFKIINDSLGQRFGDRLLQEIARRLTLATGRQSLVARVGGAEFAVVVDNISMEDLPAVAQRVMTKLAAQYTFFGNSLNVFCHMGISSFPKDGTDCDTMLGAAETALCCSREEGLNGYRIFTDEMNERVQEGLRMERGLRDALTKNELFLVYQPQVDLRTGRVTGLEALLRWEHPQDGLIPPGKFIGVAESSGMILPIGEWVLRT
ncbi:MAG TPA: diguanylate cyclase, partial [Terracidiphilus sp.]|nr:diguanylate cyclase [Terracidiphilus sp.]